MLRFVLLPLVGAALLGCEQRPAGQQRVVVYVSLDRDYAEPILKRFQEETGIVVEPVYDTEKDKSVGLTARLEAEKDVPRADVFWNNEVVNTIRLARGNVFTAWRPPAAEDVPERFRDGGGLWTGFAGRARVIVYNTNKLKSNSPPQTPAGLAPFGDRSFRAAFARPVAGTTATHLSALFAMMDPAAAKALLRDLKRAGVSFDVPANSDVARMVAAGELAVGFTDTDDALELIRQGKPIQMVFPNGERPAEKTLIIPNTVSLVAGGPNPENGKKLVNFLASRRVEQLLTLGPSGQIPLRTDIDPPKQLPGLPKRADWAPVDYNRAADFREEAAKFVRETLLN
jgi:iron(III) transport system substrate-binding protein